MTSFDDILEMKKNKDLKSLILNLNNENVDIRAFIAQTLGDIGDNSVVVPLIESLKDNNTKVRKESAMSLGLLSNIRSVKPLIEVLKDDNEDVRQIAAFALIKIGDKRSIEPLNEVMKEDDSEDVRQIAALGVEALQSVAEIDEDLLEDYKEKLQLNIKPKSFLRTPPEIIQIISKIASYSKPKTVLEPACGSGSLLLGLESTLNINTKITALGMNKEFVKNDLILNNNIDLVYDDFFKFKNNTQNKYDLIVSDMFIYNINQENIAKKSFKFKIAVLLDSLELLNDEGRLIFLIPEYFLYSDKFLKIRNFIKEKYSLEGIISIPPKISFLYAGVKASILIIKNSRINESFFAEYKDSESTNIIIDNFVNHNVNKNPSQGLWIETSGFDKLTWINYLKDYKLPTKNKIKSKFNVKPLSKIIKFKDKSKYKFSIAFPKSYSPNDNNIFKFVGELSHQEKESNSFNFFDITDNNINPQYLKLYLNSEKFTKQLEKIILEDGTLDLDYLKTISIEFPSKDEQNIVLDAEKKIRDLQNKITYLNNKFYGDYSNFKEIIDITDYMQQKELIWPLVNLYHIAQKSTINHEKKIKKYFKLFEFIAALNSIVLISSLSEELFFKEKNFIFDFENPKNDYSKVTFGMWVGLYYRLSEIFSDMKENKSFYETLPLDKNFYLKLIDNKYFTILNKVVEKRNDYIHGDDELTCSEEKALLTELSRFSNEIFELLNVYTTLEMVYTISMQKHEGLYCIKVKKMIGASYPFYEDTLNSQEDMDTGVIYLYDCSKDKRLKLKTEFIRLKECDKCGKWSLYIYNKLKNKKTHYISYHGEIHPFDDSKNPMRKIITHNKT